MEMKTLPITELRSLLAAVSDHSKQHLVEVEADLLQMTFLLSEAIEKLGTSFMAVHESVSRQQQILDDLMAEHQFKKEEAGQLNALKEKIGEEVNAAVIGLQFQDLTSQLTARIIKRVNGLKKLLGELATYGDGMEPSREHKEIARFLEEMSCSLHAGSNALSGKVRRSVNQQNMANGEIELF